MKLVTMEPVRISQQLMNDPGVLNYGKFSDAC